MRLPLVPHSSIRIGWYADTESRMGNFKRTHAFRAVGDGVRSVGPIAGMRNGQVCCGGMLCRRCPLGRALLGAYTHQRHAVLLRRSEGAATYQPGAERSAAPGTQRASTGGRASREP